MTKQYVNMHCQRNKLQHLTLTSVNLQFLLPYIKLLLNKFTISDINYIVVDQRIGEIPTSFDSECTVPLRPGSEPSM